MIQVQTNLERNASPEVSPTASICSSNSLDHCTWQKPLNSKYLKTLCKNLDCSMVKQFHEYATIAGGGRIRLKHSKESIVGTAMSENPGSNFKRFKNFPKEKKKLPEETAYQYGNPLRLYGGAPTKDNSGKTPAMINAQRFDKIIAAYQKAIDPRRQPSTEDGAPPYLVRLFDGSDDSLDDQKGPCGTRRCPSARLSYKPPDSSFGKSQSVSCGLAGCPRAKSANQLDAETEEKIAEFEALQRSATRIKSPSKCPSSFLPPVPPLQTIHWDCPDPLPKGGICDNPQCPLKPQQCRDTPGPKGSCGTVKCPYSIAVLCGDECPSNQPEIIPYTPPPPPPPPPPCPPPPCYLPPPCYSPPPPCYSPPPPCPPPPCPPPRCYSPPPPCYPPYPCYPPPPCPPPSRSCRNPRCPHSPPPCPPAPPLCSNPRCPHSPPPCSPKPPLCPNPRCPHSPPPCPPKPSLCPNKKCPFSP